MSTVWSNKEIEILIDCYNQKMNISEIIKMLDGKRTEAAIRNKAKDLKITTNIFWTDEDINIIVESYNNGLSNKQIFDLLDGRKSISAIRYKLQELNLFRHNSWTKDEEEILKQYYENTYFYKIQEMLPTHSRGSITWKARLLGLKPFIFWTKDEEEYLKNNWELIPDEILAKNLNRTEGAIRDKRGELRLLRRNKDSRNAKYLSNILRTHILDWKKQSMNNCDYKCIFTGSKDFDIHHIYSMHYIVEETLVSLGYNIDDIHTKNYSNEDIDIIINRFKEIHEKYPLGVCISKKIHQLYHKLYGANNTPEQWEKFKIDYSNNVYA